MATYTIDTAAAIRKMTEAGLPEKQAIAVVDTFAEAHERVASKADLDLLEARLMKWIIAMPVATVAALGTVQAFLFG